MVTLETLVIYTGDHFSAHTCSDLSLEKNCLLPLEVILSLPKKCLNTQSNLKIFSPLLFFFWVLQKMLSFVFAELTHTPPPAPPPFIFIYPCMIFSVVGERPALSLRCLAWILTHYTLSSLLTTMTALTLCVRIYLSRCKTTQKSRFF